MNSVLIDSSGEKSNQEDSIEFNYRKGVDFFNTLLKPYKSEPFDNEASYRLLAIQYFKRSLQCSGRSEEQLFKIRSLLFLTRLHPESKIEQEHYFYSAIEMAQRYLGDDFYKKDLGSEIMSVYLIYIDSAFREKFLEEYIPLLIPLLYTSILSESKIRREKRLEKIANTGNYLNKDVSVNDILAHLEEAFGAFRLLIVSEDSNEILINKGCNDNEARILIRRSSNIHHISTTVLDRPRKYLVLIDHGSEETINQFKESHLQHIVIPIIEIFIIKKEYTFFECASDNADHIDLIEANMVFSSEKNDYKDFITSVVLNYSDPMESRRSRNSKDYIDNCLKAIDICRCITLHRKETKEFSLEKLFQEIDTILGGHINRSVLHMVKSILLSRNETMNGTGYPHNLSKKNIPLAGRIYSVIRSFEALCLDKRTPEMAMATMQDWSQGGYFDSEVLRIFFETQKSGKIVSKSSTLDTIIPVSEFRKSLYQPHIELWYRLLGIIKEISDIYEYFHRSEGDKSKQNIASKKINELQLSLIKLADIKKIFIITPHGKTPSDKDDGPPGDDDEILTEDGEESSVIKGELLKGLLFLICMSPLPRAIQTAKIICKKVSNCVESCLSCHATIPEETLRNPPKNTINGRYYSLLQKVVTDNSDGLRLFLLGLISSSDESTTVFITHRDIFRHVIIWLKNLFSQEVMHGEKVPVTHETIMEILFCGDHIIEGPEAKTRGLIFSFRNWQSLVGIINNITQNIFGENFYETEDNLTDLIELHYRFLDYINTKSEYFPQETAIFLEQLRKNPNTAYYIMEILRAETTLPINKAI